MLLLLTLVLLLACGRMTAHPMEQALQQMEIEMDALNEAQLADMHAAIMQDYMRETMQNMLAQLQQQPLQYSDTVVMETLVMFHTADTLQGIVTEHYMMLMPGESEADAIIRYATVLTEKELNGLLTGGEAVSPDRAALFHRLKAYKARHWKAVTDEVYSDYIQAALGDIPKNGLLTRYFYLRIAWALNLFRGMHGLEQFSEDAVAASIRV